MADRQLWWVVSARSPSAEVAEAQWVPLDHSEARRFLDYVETVTHTSDGATIDLGGWRRSPLPQALRMARLNDGFLEAGTFADPRAEASGVIDLPAGDLPGSAVVPDLHLQRSGVFWWSYSASSQTCETVSLEASDVVRVLPFTARTPAELAHAFTEYARVNSDALLFLLNDHMRTEPLGPDAPLLRQRFPQGLPREALATLLEARHRGVREAAIRTLGHPGTSSRVR